MNKTFKLGLIATAALVSTGCVTMDGNMIDSAGNTANCSTKGGGVGLGMVVGAAIAAADNQLCESSHRDKGYLLVTKVGVHGIVLPEEPKAAPVTSKVEPPASQCLFAGDRIARVNGTDTADVAAARQALFAPAGTPVSVEVARSNTVQVCQFELTKPQ